LAKKRIYQVAREYHLSSEALVSMLKEMGFEVKGHMSTVTEEMAKRVSKRFEEQKESFRQEIKRKKEAAEIRKPEQKKPEQKKVAKTAGAGKKKKKWKETAPKFRKAKERSRREKRTVDRRVVAENIRKTLAKIETPSPKLKKRRTKTHRPGEIEEERTIIKVSEFISVAELAQQMDVNISTLIAKCLEMGLVVSINQRLDMDTIVMVADEFGFEVEALAEFAEDILEEEGIEDQSQLVPRPPVVTVMGHVDHGKTSLLDYVRKSNIIAGEKGGITQHIGAYEVQFEEGKITFLDTPGHEAFTAMRARGAQITDIVVLVVAADAHVMPQTVEAIDHARAAGVSMIVAINKIDLPTANPDRIKQELTDRGLLSEEWGGKTMMVEVSAKTGQGVDNLLEAILLEAELLDLKANSTKRVKGTIIEAKLDRGRGPMATVLVKEGTLLATNTFVTGIYSGRVRGMFDERGASVSEAGPAVPVQILGLEGVPQAGDSFFVVSSEQQARAISQKRQLLSREQEHRKVKRLTLTDLAQQIKEGEVKQLPLIIKGDVDGSVEALSDALMQLSTEEVSVNIIHRGVGAVSESDVLLAVASNAVIIGFHVRPDARARELAVQEQVNIKFYQIIYDVVNDVKGLLFQSGLIRRGAAVRVLRDSIAIYEGTISSLKRFKEDVKEVQAGYECGAGIQGFNDLKDNDTFEIFETVETPRDIDQVKK
jgi:translation initiation factor IF-2